MMDVHQQRIWLEGSVEIAYREREILFQVKICCTFGLDRITVRLMMVSN